MKKIAIIPARGGSKRIPKKNIRLFLGKPIIYYPIRLALQSGLFDEVMVSTDDPEIATVAAESGVSVPFPRSSKISEDYSTTADVLEEVIREYKKINREFDIGCCIYPAAPLLTLSNLQRAFEMLTRGHFDTVFPVVRYTYPIQRAMKIENNRPSLVWPENQNKRSQDFPPSYHDAGQFYWFRIPPFLVNKNLFTENSAVIILEEMEAQDIDDLADWKIAEIKYQLMNSQAS